jgi:hypothetical protein
VLLLLLRCAVSATIRKCLTDAILREAVLDRTVESLVSLYTTDSADTKTKFSANLSLEKITTEFKWPKQLATISAANIPDLKSKDFDVWYVATSLRHSCFVRRCRALYVPLKPGHTYLGVACVRGAAGGGGWLVGWLVGCGVVL